MTHKAYFDEPLVLHFQAQIVAVEAQADGSAQVMLDRTYFYPTGGGQSCDTGTINGLTVREVRTENGNVLHRVDGIPAIGAATCEIERQTRIGNMHAHTGQHILSAAFVHTLEAETVAVKMNAVGASTVDVTLGNLSPEQIAQVETRANDIIMENRAILSYFVPADDPRLEDLRRAVKFEKVSGDVRLVEITDWDLSACAGTHFPFTGMLGILKIIKVENYKGGSRVHFVAGYQALEQFRRYQSLLDQTAAFLSSSADDVPALVTKLQTEKQELARAVAAQRETLLSLERDQMRAQALQIGGRSIIATGFEGRTADEIRILANQLAEIPLTIAVLVNRQGEQSAVAVSAATDSGIHAGNLLKAIVEQFGGRGGGRETYAQGTCPATDSATILATAHNQIQALLSS